MTTKLRPSSEVKALLDHFLSPSPGQTPEAIRERILYWKERADHPERFTTDENKYAIAARRKTARQNLRRLLTRNPDIASCLRAEQIAEVTR